MTNKKVFILIVACIFLHTLAAIEPPEGWRALKSIEVEGPNRYKIFPLDKEVYRYCREDLGDLRIIDEEGGFSAYYIEKNVITQEKEVISYTTKLIKNYTVQDEETKRMNRVLHYQIVADTEIATSRLAFTIPGVEYSVPIKIYGRYDSTKWKLIKNDTLYHIEKFIKNEVDLEGVYGYNFYRIILIEESPVPESMVPYITTIDRQYKKFTKTASFPFSTVEQEGDTVIIIENMYRLKIRSLYFFIKGNFNRQFSIYSDGSLFHSEYLFNFRYNNGEISDVKMDFGENLLKGSQVKIIITNYDDSALEVNDIRYEYITDRVVFKAEKGKRYYLGYENPSALTPVYDIAILKEYIKQEKKDLCRLGSLERKEIQEPEQEKTDYKFFFNIIIIIISLVLVFFLIFRIRRK